MTQTNGMNTFDKLFIARTLLALNQKEAAEQAEYTKYYKNCLCTAMLYTPANTAL